MLTHAKQITTFSSLLRQASSSHATCPIRSPEMLLQRHFVQLSKTQRENISNPILYGASERSTPTQCPRQQPSDIFFDLLSLNEEVEV